MRITSDSTTLLKPPAPFCVNVELTSLCNQKCIMCPLTAGNTLSSKNQGHMTPETWERVLAAACVIGQIQWIGYGETLLHPKALDYMQEADELGVWSSLATNGICLTEELSQRLGKLKHLVHINVSIDSLNGRVFQEIRKTPLHKTLAGVRKLVRHVDKRKTTIATVIMEDNIETLFEFPPYLASLGLQKYQINVLHEHKGKHFRGELNGGSERNRTALAALKQSSADHGIQLIVDVKERLEMNVGDSSLFAEQYKHSPSHGKTRRCMLPWEFPFIDKDGSVFLCSNSTSSSKEVMGSLLEDDFMSIWHNEKFQSVRSAFLETNPLPDACAKCTIQSIGTHPLVEFQAEIQPSGISCRKGAKGHALVSVAFKNTGKNAWRPGEVAVGTARPRDRISALYNNEWLSINRVAKNEALVAPGATSQFNLRLGAAPNSLDETFQLVVDGKGWIPNTEIRLRNPITSLQRVPIRAGALVQKIRRFTKSLI